MTRATFVRLPALLLMGIRRGRPGQKRVVIRERGHRLVRLLQHVRTRCLHTLEE